MTTAVALVVYLVGVVTVFACGVAEWDIHRNLTTYQEESRRGARAAMAAPLWPVLLPIALGKLIGRLAVDANKVDDR